MRSSRAIRKKRIPPNPRRALTVRRMEAFPYCWCAESSPARRRLDFPPPAVSFGTNDRPPSSKRYSCIRVQARDLITIDCAQIPSRSQESSAQSLFPPKKADGHIYVRPAKMPNWAITVGVDETQKSFRHLEIRSAPTRLHNLELRFCVQECPDIDRRGELERRTVSAIRLVLIP